MTSFIQGSINYAKRDVRGLDFNVRYGFETADLIGHDFGRIAYSLRGSWLIEQENYNNIDNPNDVTTLDTNLFYPRVRFTSTVAYMPTDRLTLTWAMDWQTAQDIVKKRDMAANWDNRFEQYYDTGDFARHDFTVNYQMRDNLSVRAGVTNAFDAEQARWLATTLYSNFDPWGRRFFVGFNYRPW